MKPATENEPNPWEAAYLRFETPEQEIHKFMGRLRKLGAAGWKPEAQIIDLFCGRGNGVNALQRLGFSNVEGVDLSPALIAQYQGTATMHVADCRALPFPDSCKDIAIVQGGLHHLPQLPEDLERTLAEVKRVLRPGGMFVAVEPWLTPFLKLTHTLCGVAVVRKLSAKFDALAIMIEHERQTYEQWLGQPTEVLRALHRHFEPKTERTGWGKLLFVGCNTDSR